MNLLRRLARTQLGAVVLTLALLLVVGIGSAIAYPVAHGSSGGLRGWLSRAMRSALHMEVTPAATPTDTIIVFGPKQAATPTGASATTVEQFSLAQADVGRQYMLKVENGATDGSARVSTGTVQVNGAIVISSSELTALASGVSLFKTILVQQSGNTIVATVQGAAGSYVTVSVVAAPDPTFTVWGSRTYERDRSTPVTITERFTLPAGAGAPFYLHMINGDGGRRSSSASVKLNGTQVIGAADLNQTVAGLVKPVTLLQDNVLEVRLQGDPGSRLTLRVAATDVAAPVLSITAPTAGQVTKERSFTVTGSVTDQTPTQITANGVVATVQGSSNGASGFSADVPLGNEGANTITIHAVDAAGHATDSVRTLIRDTEAPVVDVTSLPDTATVSADSSVVVSGSIHDATKLTANLNGVRLSVDSVTGAFSQRVALQSGVNFLTIVATDAAGNATTVVRQVTRDASPPTLMVTSPADSLVTKATSIRVSGNASASTAVTVTVNGSPVSLSGNSAFATDVALTEGPNAIAVVATTAAGVRVSTSRTVIRDTQAPAMQLTQPEDSLVTSSGTVTVSGTVADATALTLSLNGVPVTVDAAGTFSTTLPLVEGPATLTLVATDAAGNATTITRHVVRDATPPAITLLDPAPGAMSRVATYRVTGSVSDQSSVVVTVNGTRATIAADGGFAVDLTLADGANPITVIATDAAGNHSQATGSVMFDAAPPEVTLSAPATDGSVTRTATLAVTGTAVDRTGATVTVNGIPASIDGTGAFSVQVTLVEGANTITVMATDGAGNTITSLRQITLDTQAPTLTLDAPQNGAVVGSDGNVTVSGSVSDATTVTLVANGASIPVTAGSFSMSLAAPVDGIVKVTATDAAGNETSVTRTLDQSSSGGGGLPPDPRVVAPVLNRTVATTVAASTAFLYSGSNPIQTGVASGTITSYQASVVRGQLITRDGQALAGVQVSVKDHPEFGQTLSRADGAYDLAVNGGGAMTFVFTKQGLLPAQRTLIVPRQRWAVMPAVAMVPLDSLVTVVDVSQPASVARGSVVTDASGTRQATAIFAQGTEATMVMPDGSLRPVGTLAIRATEYTVGPNGPASMPAALPPSSAYTYATELSVDEAQQAGATSVQFSEPVTVYVENFIGFPVGGIVPVASYDRVAAAWKPEPNGRVVKVLSVDGGRAALDVSGSGTPAPADSLAALGVSDAELVRLASLYPVGQSLWRYQLSHFTPHDANWPYPITKDDGKPRQKPPKGDDSPDKQPCQSGSIIGCERRTLGEVLPITGTDLSLVYSSERTPGYRQDYSFDVPLSDNVPSDVLASIDKILMRVSVAGQVKVDTFPAQAGLHGRATWDGRDAYGRLVQGQQRMTIEVGYTYNLLPYGQPAAGTASFGQSSGQPLNQYLRFPTQIWQTVLDRPVGAWSDQAAGLGGWSISTHHSYDPSTGSLYLGTGERRTSRGMNATLEHVASASGYSLVVEADGSVLVASFTQVFRVARDGTFTYVAGSGSPSYNGDGGPATSAGMEADVIAKGPDGSLYIGDTYNKRLRRVDRNGLITTVAGNGTCGDGGDGLLAAQAQFCTFDKLLVDKDGNIYVSSGSSAYHPTRVRKISPDGRVSNFAGIANQDCVYSSGDARCLEEGPATALPLGEVGEMAAQPDGSVLISSQTYGVSAALIWKVSPGGVRTRFAGNAGYAVDNGDGGLATDAHFAGIQHLAAGSDGAVYVAGSDEVVRKIAPSGIVSTVAGIGRNNYCGDAYSPPCPPFGSNALQVPMPSVYALAVSAENVLHILDVNQHEVWRLAAPLATLDTKMGTATRDSSGYTIASEDGAFLFRFDSTGRHLETRDQMTGAYLQRFAYSTSGQLASITDASGNVTAIERAGTGEPLSLVAANGQHSTVTLDSAGNLASLRAPGGETERFSYDPHGLMRGHTDPSGASHEFVYDEQGLLLSDLNADGLIQTLATEYTADGKRVTISTGTDEKRSYLTEATSVGLYRRAITDAAGLTRTTTVDFADYMKIVSPDGTILTSLRSADPTFGMLVPTERASLITPGGVMRRLTSTRTRVVNSASDPFSLRWQIDSLVENGAVTTLTFDASTHSISTRTPAGRGSVAKLDSLGRIVSMSYDGLSTAAIVYDERGRVKQLTDAGRRTQFSYDALGRLEVLTDALGARTRLSRDSVGRIISVRDSASLVQFAYDSAGRLTSISPNGGAAHVFRYSAGGQLLEYAAPTVAGMPNTVTAYKYDSNRRLRLVVRPGDDSLAISYDSAGRPATVTSAEGTTAFVFGATDGLLANISSSSGASYDFRYDGAVPTRVTLAGGPVGGTVSYRHDSFLRPIAIAVNDDTIALTYDQDGILKSAGSLTLTPNQTTGVIDSSRVDGVTIAFEHDSTGGLLGAVTKLNDASLYEYHLERDVLERVTRRIETIGGETTDTRFAYDSAGRLFTVTRDGTAIAAYTYDANGNRLLRATQSGTEAGVVDPQDRLTSYAGALYRYSYAGELQSRIVGGDTTLYHYDASGALRFVVLSDGTRIDYVIDPVGRRIGRRVNGVLTHSFIYENGPRIAAELASNGAVRTRFVYGTLPNVPEYMERDSVRYRIVSDHLGSVRLVVNSATGQVLQRIDYDEFGRITLNTNPGFQPFGYAGGLQDDMTGLVRFGVRDYDPAVGRFTSKDPSGFVAGANLYIYANNSPVSFNDPSGRFSWMPSTWLVDATAGFGDGVLLDIPAALRGDADALVNKCSTAYSRAHLAGTAVTVGLGVGRLAYAALLRGIPAFIGASEVVTVEDALEGSALRNSIKTLFRGDLTGTSTFRMYDPASLLEAKGGDAAALLRSATRSNMELNALAATAATGAAISEGSRDCGCRR